MNEQLNNEIRTALDQWLKTFNTNDLEALMSLYDPEINYVNSNAPIKIGIPVVKEGFSEMFAIQPNVIFNEEQIIASENLGYIAGQFRVTGTHPEDGSEVGEAGRVVCVFRKNAAGDWKLVFDMDNRPPDVTI